MFIKKAFLPVVTPLSTVLILGTMPGEKSLQLQEYYGNRGNQFWRLMFSVFGEALIDNYDEKISFLNRHHIALWDVLAYCERQGSLDSNIKNEVANDFKAFYTEYPRIKFVLFSSKNAEKYYDKFVGKKPELTYYTLPSPSGANATMRFEEKLEIWRVIFDAVRVL
ncbi:DNA-deoxyinosine glycosylase [Flavobacterium sp. RHBU_3]|uniref:DNA-deoxyinosine glycosylase n=1 Tax=Flavobacterium sp. RHBU_3 TaxID=3391184 RepID=UPI003984AFBD